MTPNSPTFGDIRRFLKIDGWREVPPQERGGSRQRHIFFEKVLSEGRVLRTKVSHADQKSPTPGTWRQIARHELEVAPDAFWECLRTGEPVARPAPTEEIEYQHPAWVIRILAGSLHMKDAEIAALDPDEAEARARAYWEQR